MTTTFFLSCSNQQLLFLIDTAKINLMFQYRPEWKSQSAWAAEEPHRKGAAPCLKTLQNIYLYILTVSQKGKRRILCDTVLNAAANCITRPIQNVMFARAAAFLSLLKNSTNCGKNKDPNSRLKRISANKPEKIT